MLPRQAHVRFRHAPSLILLAWPGPSCDSLRFTFRVFRPELPLRIIDACEAVETGEQYHVTDNR